MSSIQSLTSSGGAAAVRGGAFVQLKMLLTRHRQLTWEMAKREITERYTGQIFGAFWAIAHPLVLILVYLYVFGVVFRVRTEGMGGMTLDYTTYLLAGLIPWLGVQEAMAKSAMVIVNHSNLVKQVVFPLEVLPAKAVIATMITETVFLALLTIYILVRYHWLPGTYLLLPLLLVLQTLAMMGISYVLSGVGAYLRDTKDIIQVLVVVGVYLLPIFYLPASVPAQFRALMYLNPFSYMIWCFQDALYFGRFEHPWAWPVFAALSLATFFVGFSIFNRVRVMFGNVL
jgi:lipopolysaccharide transport system permease protein